MNDLTNDEQQQQEPETAQQPLKEEPPERETLPEEQEALNEKVEAAKKQISDFANQLNEADEQRRQMLNKAIDSFTEASRFSESLTNSLIASLPDISSLSASLVESAATAIKEIAESGLKIAAFCQSEAYKELQKYVTGFDAYFGRLAGQKEQFAAGDFSFLGTFVENIDELLPYIKEEVESYKKETGREEITFEEFIFADIDPDTGKETTSILEKVLIKAQERADQGAAEQAAAIAETARKLDEVAKYRCIHPDRYYQPNTNLSYSMTGRKGEKAGEKLPVIEEGPFDLPLMEGLTAYTVITFDAKGSGVDLTGEPFTEFDRCVFNAICSLIEAGNNVFAPEWVQWAMNNRRGAEMVSPATIEDITISIEKMRHIHILCDVSEEMKRRSVTDDEGNIIENYIIDDDMLTVRAHHIKTANGELKVRYEIKGGKPALLTYSQITGQIINADIRLLDIKKVQIFQGKHRLGNSIPTTTARQPIKEYLLRRIKTMKNDQAKPKPRLSRRILFDSLYLESDVDTKNRENTRRAREYAFMVLDYWQEIGEIKGYQVVKKGRKVYGIDIKI